MVGDDISDKIKPKQRKASQDLAFKWNAARQDYIKTGYSVRGNNEQFIVQIVNIPDLAAFE
jgi:hypothetical protein